MDCNLKIVVVSLLYCNFGLHETVALFIVTRPRSREINEIVD